MRGSATWKVPGPRIGWRPLERIAFGLIYGAIMVLSLLMAMNEAAGSPFDMAIVLFGSVLAITLARAFAELLSHAIQTGERVLTRQALLTAWRGSHPTLSVANLPTALFVAAGLEWLTVGQVVIVSQVYSILILVLFGARVGWVISRGPWLSVGGAVFSGGIGVALAAMKYLIHWPRPL
jgi:hypothetical protein